jgi:hypothetical protein
MGLGAGLFEFNRKSKSAIRAAEKRKETAFASAENQRAALLAQDEDEVLRRRRALANVGGNGTGILGAGLPGQVPTQSGRVLGN